MDSISGGGGGRIDAGAVYDVEMVRRAQDLQKLAGQNAVRLIDAAQVRPENQPQPRPLPADATISVRV